MPKRSAPPQRSWLVPLSVAALAYLIAITFVPMLDFDFIRYDVREQLLEDPHVQGISFENLKQIFTTRRISSYYPIRTLTFALDYQVWGYAARGFKLTNGLIHLANVLLVFWLVLRLLGAPPPATRREHMWQVGLAFFGGAVYAVHPVVVEPVVWVAGREELLMTLGALGCLHFHLTARRLSDAEEPTKSVIRCYIGSAICCAFACLSNAIAAIIPALMVAWDLLMLRSPRKNRIVQGTRVLWLIGAATIVTKMFDPMSGVMDKGHFLSPDRALVVLNVYWLNLKTLVWPTELALRYAKVEPTTFLSPEVLMGVAAVSMTLIVLWLVRRQKIVFYGLLWFVLALAPSAQVMPHHIHRADRFLYLPLVGIVVALTVGLSVLTAGPRSQARKWAAAAGGAVVVLLLQLTSAGQLPTWRDDISMWNNCLQFDPESALLHAALAHSLNREERFGEARDAYEAAIQADPDDVEAHKYFALFLSECPDESLRDDARAIELATRAAELQDDPTTAMVLVKVYAGSGKSDLAIATADEAISDARAARNPLLEAEFIKLREQVLQELGP